MKIEESSVDFNPVSFLMDITHSSPFCSFTKYFFMSKIYLFIDFKYLKVILYNFSRGPLHFIAQTIFYVINLK